MAAPARPAEYGEERVAAVVVALSAGTATIHFGMIAVHAGLVSTEGAAFAVMGWAQLMLTALLARQPRSRWVLDAAVGFNTAVLLVWLASRTTGLPFGASTTEPEAVGVVDSLASLFELGVVLGCLDLQRSVRRGASAGEPGRWTPQGLAAIGLTVGLAALALTGSADHAGHAGHGFDAVDGFDAGPTVAAVGHDHAATDVGELDECAGLQAALDDPRHAVAEIVDRQATLGCTAESTQAGTSPGDPALDGSPFVDRLVADVSGAIATAELAVCNAPNLPPGLLGAAVGVLFTYARDWQSCGDPSAETARVAVALYDTRYARDAAATADVPGTVARWVYGRFVIAVLDGAPASITDDVGAALAGLEGVARAL
jgi:hypothetical protein